MMAGSESNKQMPTEKELAAYNEAGHAIAGRLQGQNIGPMQIYQGEDGRWGGCTQHNTAFRPFLLDMLPDELHRRLGIPIPQGGTVFSLEEQCTMKYAGVVAERLLCDQRGVSSDKVRIGEADIIEAEGLVSRLPQAQAHQVLRLAEAQAWKILRDHACWRAVEVLAQELVQKGKLDQERIHSIVSQALLS
jgi:hypothetical protein